MDIDLDQSRSHAPESSLRSSSASASSRERLDLVSKLFAAYPTAQRDTTAAIAVYLEETADIPIPWLREGLARLRNEPGRVFLPSVSELRTASARAVVSARRAARGEPEHAAVPQLDVDVAGVIEWSAQHAPMGLAQLTALESGKRSEVLRMAANAAAAAQIDAGPRGRGVREALVGVLDSTRVVEPDGSKSDVAEEARKISAEGKLVPAWSRGDSAAVNGRYLALLLAYRRAGRDVPTAGTTSEDVTRYDRIMYAHDARIGSRSDWYWDDIRQPLCREAANRTKGR